MNAHLGGGEGDITLFLEHRGLAMKGWWADLGRIEHVNSQMAEKAEAGINEILEVNTAIDTVDRRDSVLLDPKGDRAAGRIDRSAASATLGNREPETSVTNPLRSRNLQ